MFMFFVICMVGERDWCMKLGGVCSCLYIYICILTMSFNHLIKYGGLSKKSVRRQDSMA